MIDLIDVSKSYGPGLPAVNHANLHVDKGEFVFIVGNSGSGKSTLIKLLLKELDSTSGTIIVSGEKLEGMKHRRVAKESSGGTSGSWTCREIQGVPGRAVRWRAAESCSCQSDCKPPGHPSCRRAHW